MLVVNDYCDREGVLSACRFVVSNAMASCIPDTGNGKSFESMKVSGIEQCLFESSLSLRQTSTTVSQETCM